MTQYPSITDETLIAELKRLADESPDYVYGAPAHMTRGYEGTTVCLYVHTDPGGDESKDAPGCIVGKALHRLGVPLATLAEFEHYNPREIAGEILPGVTISGSLFAGRVQRAQDRGKTWRAAVDYAKEAA